jgi:hypothetical protein
VIGLTLIFEEADDLLLAAPGVSQRINLLQLAEI